MFSINSLPNTQIASLYTNSISLPNKLDTQEETSSSNSVNMNIFDTLEKMGEEMEKELDRKEFDNFIKEARGEFDDKDIDNLIKYQNQGTALEESGDVGGAQKVWDKFDAILEKYDALGDDDSKTDLAQNAIGTNMADKLNFQIENLKQLFSDDDSIKELTSLSKDAISKMSYENMFEKLDKVFSSIEKSLMQSQPLGNRLDLSA